MKSEMNSLVKNKSYEIVKLPPGKEVLKTKWVLTEKRDKAGKKKFKARLVIKGCSQKQGINYQETFSPVVKYASLRYLFSLAAKENLRIDHMDVTTAYLQSDLNEEIHVQPPWNSKENTGMVWRLKKAIYGLKQSGRCWNEKLHDVLTTLGLTQSKSDPCIYSLKNKTGQILIVAVYVDDLLIFTNQKGLRENLKKNLQKQFEMKDLGTAKRCIGMNISRNTEERKLWIDQKDYVEAILKKHQMMDCKAVDTPLESGLDFSESNNNENIDVPYQETIGSLLYLSQISRPDIAYAISLLSRYNNCYTMTHWNAVKRVLRYLKGTVNYRLEFNSESAFDAYCDADWGNKLNDRYSVTGSCIKVNGGLISWYSKRQKTVALSTTEAEYMALSFTVQEALWIKQLISEVCKYEVQKPLAIHCDNVGQYI